MIEAEVTLNIIVPFIEKEVAIKKRAVERAWAGKSK